MSPDVLERNVRLLLRRAYVPALPTPLFRDRLEPLVLRELERRAARARPARALPWQRLVVAAAAALALALLGWRFLAPEAAATRSGLLARGEVALGLADGTWRAADEEERVHGLVFVPPALVAATPAGIELHVLVGTGRVHVGASSEVALARTAGLITATLRLGTAWFVRGEERVPLIAGTPLVLDASAQHDATTLAGGAATTGREAAPTNPAVSSEPQPVAAERALAGRVTAGGQPVKAFTIALLLERRGNATPPPLTRPFTAEDGRFRWPAPPAGKHRVFVHAEGFALGSLGEHELGGELPELDVQLTPGVTLGGFVIDGQGNPIDGALVLSEQDTPTDGLLLAYSENAFWLPIQARSAPDGSFELAHLNPGTHTLRASARGFATGWLTGVRAPAAPGEELLLVLGEGGTIAGQVKRADGGPWAGAEIVAVTMDQVERARTNFAYVRTEADGGYRIEHVPATTMVVVFLRSNEQPDVRPVQVVEGLTVRADFESEPRGTRLHGRVLDEDGQPLALRNIGLFDAETASWSQDWVASSTNADGSYVFERVEPGRYELLMIDDVGRGLQRVDQLELPAGVPEVEHDVTVPDAGLDVRLSDSEGKPVALSSVIVTSVAGGRENFAAYGPSGDDGWCRFPHMLPGEYRVTVYPSQAGLGYAQSEVVRVEEHHTATLELVHEAGGLATIRVHAGDGRALEGAAIVFHDESGAEHMFSRVPLTDASGRYQAFGLRAGRYRVEAWLEGWHGEPVAFRYELGSEPEIPIVLAPSPDSRQVEREK
jgi:carboxypeptidase family protein